ncbi:MAG: ABC transporter substrate-binding protein [Frankiales bacterium]|nr:ABC transporter substrate-binding protein [Frankiales bacterium]
MITISSRRVGGAALGLSAVLALAACGSSNDSTSSTASSAASSAAPADCTLPPGDIKIVSVDSMTGPAAFAGVLAEQGASLAVKEINSSSLLGSGVTMSIDVQDDATSPDGSASAFTKAAADPSVPAILGPILSAGGVATAPIAEKEKVPVVYTQAGSPGVVIGDWTFRYTPPMDSYWADVKPYVQQQGVKSISVLYANDNPTLISVAEKALPAMAQELGIKVLSSTGLPNSTQDFKAPISKILSENPDAVAVLMVGAQNATVVQQLRQQGWNPPKVLLGFAGIENNFKDLGKTANGVTWATVWSPDSTEKSVQDFVKAFTAEYGNAPTSYSAERYDATYLIANALKKACSTDRQKVRDAMAEITSQPVVGAMGTVTFDKQDARIPGLLAEWKDTQLVLIK